MLSISKISLPSREYQVHAYENDIYIGKVYSEGVAVSGFTAASKHEIIPHRLTDGNNLINLPTLRTDAYSCTSLSEINLTEIPANTEEYSLWACVDGGNVVYKWVLQ